MIHKRGDTTMPFTPNQIPFYQAVELFESESYQAAFDIFAVCAEKGNLYAVFYLDYLLKDKKSDIKIPEENSEFLKTLDDYLKHIPLDWKPEAWFKASLSIIAIKKNNDRKFLGKLKALSPYAPNAAWFCYEYCKPIALQPEKSQVSLTPKEALQIMNLALLDLMLKPDVYSVFHAHQILNAPVAYLIPKEYAGLPEQIKIEWQKLDDMFQKTPTFFHYGAHVERLISKLYGGKIYEKSGIKVLKSSPFTKDIFFRQLKWQRSAAFHGSKELQFMFYEVCFVHKRPEVSEEQALCWLYMAAHNNDARAQVRYGFRCYEAEDNVEARLFFERALNNKDNYLGSWDRAQACLNLGKMQEDGRGGFEKNDEKAIEFYLAGQEFPMCLGNIAVFYQTGRGGLPKDYTKALHFFEKAIEDGNRTFKKTEIDEYHSQIGNLYLTGGYGLERDLVKAAKHYKLGMETNKAALTNYAIALYHGRGVPKNKPEAFKLLKKAADLGILEAIYQLLISYCRQEIRDPFLGLTERKILAYIKTLCDAPREANSLEDEKTHRYSLAGICYLKYLPSGPNYPKALQCFEKGADKKEVESLIQLGQFYEHGYPALKISIDSKKAYGYYKIAAELGNALGLNNMAYCLTNGVGVELDFDLAKKSFEESLSKKELLAAYGLGCMYALGQGVTVDHNKAFEYFLLAEATEDPDVLFSIGVCYQLGHGCSRDIDKACSYYRRSNKLGNYNSGYNLAWVLIDKAIENGEVHETLLKEALEILDSGMKSGQKSSIYLYGMVSLLLDPTSAKSIAEKFKTALRENPHQLTQRAFNYISHRLEKNKSMTRLEILILLTTSFDPFKFFAKLDEIRKSKSKPERDEKDREKPAAINKLTREMLDSKPPMLTSYTSKISKNPSTAPESSSKWRRLIREIDWFTDPCNKKSINIKEFKRLLGQVSLYKEDLKLEILPSKSSNSRYHLQGSDSESSLSFSYHPTHGSGRGQDSEYDPGRAQSLQKVMKDVKRRVFA